jgi:V-type H+-transporting ATPase subunit E
LVFARSPISSPPRVWLNPRSIATLLVHRPTAKMNDTEVERQIHQMVSFIKQEAEEKASEIRVEAEEEFNIEKLQMVEEERRRVKKEYERKESQAEVRKKIEFSTELNAMRLKILQSRDEAVQGMLADARADLEGVSDTPKYPEMLVGLILQSVQKLEADEAVVRCRECDVGKVKTAMAEAEGQTPGLKLHLDTHVNLPPPPGPTNGEGTSCIGGVHVISMDGKITCNNSLDDRLKVAFERNLPELREVVFGANQNAAK